MPASNFHYHDCECGQESVPCIGAPGCGNDPLYKICPSCAPCIAGVVKRLYDTLLNVATVNHIHMNGKCPHCGGWGKGTKVTMAGISKTYCIVCGRTQGGQVLGIPLSPSYFMGNYNHLEVLTTFQNLGKKKEKIKCNCNPCSGNMG